LQSRHFLNEKLLFCKKNDVCLLKNRIKVIEKLERAENVLLRRFFSKDRFEFHRRHLIELIFLTLEGKMAKKAKKAKRKKARRKR